MNFSFETPITETGPIRRRWFENSPFKTACANSLSVSVPEAERFILRSVKKVTPNITDVQLRPALDILIHEEDAHSRVHDGYNALLVRQGYVIAPFEKFGKRFYHFFEAYTSVKTVLAVCLCSEYLTALTARHVINLRLAESKSIDPRMARLWEWHCLEELDHRSTVFDLYHYLGGGYLRRTLLMIVLTGIHAISHTACLISLLRQDRALDGKGGARAPGFLFGKKGFYSAIIKGWVLFFIPGFHPKKDMRLDSGLVKELRHYHIEEDIIQSLQT